MDLRSWRFLTFVLLLVAASPPPRVTNALIVATERQDPVEARKPVQSRARNRIGAPILVAADQMIAGFSRGQPRPARPSRFFSWRPDRSIAIRILPTPATFVPLTRLRC